jgi:hypothetical protein
VPLAQSSKTEDPSAAGGARSHHRPTHPRSGTVSHIAILCARVFFPLRVIALFFLVRIVALRSLPGSEAGGFYGALQKK